MTGLFCRSGHFLFTQDHLDCGISSLCPTPSSSLSAFWSKWGRNSLPKPCQPGLKEIYRLQTGQYTIGRMLAMTWSIFTVVIVSSYTANLAAFLAADKKEMKIQRWEDLLDPSIQFGTLREGSTFKWDKIKEWKNTILHWQLLQKRHWEATQRDRRHSEATERRAVATFGHEQRGRRSHGHSKQGKVRKYA